MTNKAITEAIALLDSVAFVRDEKDNTAEVLAGLRALRDSAVTLALPVSDQFCRDVLCTAVEGGSTYWAALVPLAYHKGEYGREYQRVRVCEYGDNESVQSRVNVGLPEIRAGIVRLVQGGMTNDGAPGDAHSSYRAAVVAAILDDDAGQVDANLADLIVQAAALGCVRYG